MDNWVTQELIGEEFNTSYTQNDQIYVKLTTLDEIHNDVPIVTGSNINPNSWFPYLVRFPESRTT
jgi:hypothetical protein